MNKFLLLLVALMVWCGSSIAVDLNKATQAELEALKGIGPEKAKAIIAYRKKNGDFKSADDLDKVKGVGKGIITNLGGDVTIDGRALGVPTGSDKAIDKRSAKVKKADQAAPAAAAPAEEKTLKMDKKKKQ